MAFEIDNNGDITLIQGDSGELVINGLNTDRNYSVYLAIQDEKRKPIGNEIMVNSNNQSFVRFIITSDLTDLLTVKNNEEYATYYYGVKVCDDTGYEDTLIIGDTGMGDKNTITVYPKKVEGR